MKILKIIGNCLFVVVSIFLLLILFLSFVRDDNNVSKIGNYSLLEVKGTSMYPRIKNGDLIAIDRIKQERYYVGDIVSFVLDDGTIITHEISIVEVDGDNYRYYTKGINNNYQDNDYIQIKQIIGEYKGFRIPVAGYVIGFANSKVGYFLIIVIPLGVVLGMVIKELVKEILKKRGEI